MKQNNGSKKTKKNDSGNDAKISDDVPASSKEGRDTSYPFDSLMKKECTQHAKDDNKTMELADFGKQVLYAALKQNAVYGKDMDVDVGLGDPGCTKRTSTCTSKSFNKVPLWKELEELGLFDGVSMHTLRFAPDGQLLKQKKSAKKLKRGAAVELDFSPKHEIAMTKLIRKKIIVETQDKKCVKLTEKGKQIAKDQGMLTEE